MTNTDYWATAKTVCTELELQTLTLRNKGLSRRTIALALNRSPSTIRDTLWNADRKIELHNRKDHAA